MSENLTTATSERRKFKSMRNLAWGIGSQLLISAFRFIIRTIIVRSLGMAYTSLNGLFTEIIAMLTLSELGIGTAITYSMYKPLAEGNKTKICQLMSIYKKAYRVISIVIMAAGLILMPFIPKLVADIGFAPNYIRLIFILFVAKTSISYLFLYKSGILSADQRLYVVTSIQTVFKIISSLASVGILLLTKSFVAYLIVDIIFTMITNIWISRRADKEYPYIKESLPLPQEERKELFSNIGSLFIGSLSGKITNSTDNLLITLLVGTLSVGLYSNYAMIFSMFTSFLAKFQSSISASFGNFFVKENQTRCESTLRYLTFLMCCVGCICAACIYCAMTPFVQKIWLGSDYIIGSDILFVLCINLFYSTAHSPLWVAMRSAGLFKYDKYTSISGSVINLIVSVLLGMRMGMLGIFIGTTMTHITQLVSKEIIMYKVKLHMPSFRSLMMWALYTAVCIAAMLLSVWVCNFIPDIQPFIDVFIRLAVPAFISTALLVAAFCKTPEFIRLANSLKQVVSKCKRRLHAG